MTTTVWPTPCPDWCMGQGTHTPDEAEKVHWRDLGLVHDPAVVVSATRILDDLGADLVHVIVQPGGMSGPGRVVQVHGDIEALGHALRMLHDDSVKDFGNSLEFGDEMNGGTVLDD